ncbi:hypothetical protein PAMP_020274 [Pampus punctatissimus]
MSDALLRRHSSKQGLQNLMRLTAQRSIEDAEEVERERRRRAREAFRRNSGSPPGESSQEGEMQAEESVYDGGLKPSSSPSLEEDEGFSDWTQRREKRRQQRLQELSQGGEDDEDEEDTNKEKTFQASITSSRRLQRQEPEEVQRRKEREEEEEAIRAERVRRQKEKEEEEQRKREEIQRYNTEMEKRKEVKVSYTSKVFLHQEPKHNNSSRDAADEEVTSYINNKTKRSPRTVESGEAEAILETEQRLEKIRRGLQEKESQELEQLRHRQAEAEQELEKLKTRREERRRVREEEERRREEEEQQRLAKEEEERRRMKEDIERRRMDAAERMKSLSTSSVDEDEMFSPFSPKAPTHKNSQEARAAKASLTDLPSSPEVVASKKNMFEAGEAWIQGPNKGASCKDTEGLKVGVASLITQWVKGPTDGSRQSPGKPADVKPGDVMQKKNMWEIIGDSSGRPGQRAKGPVANKKYKFVVTGHGKYEKISVDDNNEGEFTNGKSGKTDKSKCG